MSGSRFIEHIFQTYFRFTGIISYIKSDKTVQTIVFRTFVYFIQKYVRVFLYKSETKKACRKRQTFHTFYFYGFLTFLHHSSKYGCTDNCKQTGYRDGKTAHGSLYRTKLHGFCCSDGMSGSSKSQSFCHRFFQTKELTDKI